MRVAFTFLVSMMLAGRSARVVAFAIALVAASAAAAQAPGDDCGSAAPSCFAGCRESQVRTASGQCVPASAPSDAVPPNGELAAVLIAPPPHPAAPADRPCCHVALEVDAVGLKNLGDRAATTVLQADVRINGQLVGQTPFKDGLPAGDYRVEVTSPAGEVHARLALLRPGKDQRLSARFALPLDPHELELRDAWRRGRAARVQTAERAAWLRKHDGARVELQRREAAEQAEFARAHAAWEQRTGSLRAERSRRQTIGFVTGGSGLALAIAGSVLIAVAADTHGEAEAARDRWRASVDEDDRELWQQRALEAQDQRDLEHALGLSLLGVGVAGIAVGCVFLLSMPSVEQEPRPPGQLALGAGTLELAPIVSPSLFGARARLRL